MPLFNCIKPLLEMENATNENVVGYAHSIITQHAMTQSWAVFLDLEQLEGADGSSTQLVLETSADGMAWQPIGSPISLSSTGAKHELQSLSLLGPFVRARSSLSGASKASHKARVNLASNEDFRIRKLSPPTATPATAPVVAAGQG